MQRLFGHRKLWLFLGAFALLLTACNAKKDSLPLETLPKVAVRTVAIESKHVASTEDVVGTVRAKLRAVIEAKVSARIEALLVAPGQTVKAGELLAQLDSREFQAKLDQAIAVHEQAARDLARAADLKEKKITSQAEYDSVEAREHVAAGAVREMETILGYTKLTAPFDGIITRKLADVGDLVGDLAAPGKPILEMENPNALRFEADVPESLIGNVKIGAQLPVTVSAASRQIQGTVVEMAPIADAASRTFLVKLDLPASDGIRSGQFGRVGVITGEKQSIRVPVTAVVARGQVETVFVAGEDHAQLRIVRTGKRTDGDVEVLSGISPGENVVVDGADQLRDGQPITFKP